MDHAKRFDTRLVASGLLTMMAMAMAVAQAGSAPAALQGQWAGDRLQLVIDAQGGRVQSDCASGQFAGPVAPTADGRFEVQGTFDAHQPGPQSADAPASASAHYSGELRDGVLKLKIAPAGASAAQVYTLQAGARVKLRRCL
jgi:hypothetical protein